MSNYVYEDTPIKITFTWTTEDINRGGYEQNGELVDTVYTYNYKNSLEDGVNPILPNTPTGNGKYRFNHYTDPSGTEYTEDQLITATFTHNTTFTARFRYVAGGNHSGGDDLG